MKIKSLKNISAFLSAVAMCTTMCGQIVNAVDDMPEVNYYDTQINNDLQENTTENVLLDETSLTSDTTLMKKIFQTILPMNNMNRLKRIL